MSIETRLEMYTTPEKVRRYCGLTEDEASDVDLNYFIEMADRVILSDLAIPVKNLVLTGAIDGENKEFYVDEEYRPIADSDFDKTIGPSDVTVYVWTDSEDLDSRSTVAVASVNAYEGRIVLKNAPNPEVKLITADFYYYPFSTIDFNLVEQASSYYAGFLFVVREFLLIPERLTHGALRYQHARPYLQLRQLYSDTIDKIKGAIHIKKSTEEVELKREAL